ncbi:MAG: tRNA guanosine(34) transglycosylase Tgt [Candidatus Gracilibacteria bacterium]
MFNYKLIANDGKAKAGVFSTAHGNIETPIFMPVGTKATVKAITREDLDNMGAQIILNNTYHLYLRPGDEVIKSFGGVHKFQNYDKPILTDSGGFQVFSLGNLRKTKKNPGVNKTPGLDNQPLVKITENGVHFRSYIDGSKHFFTPEKVMDIQNNLGADIIMAFDECAPGDSSKEYAKKAMDRTHRWAVRSKDQYLKNNEKRIENGLHPQALFPIIQGVIYDDLRIESTNYIKNLDLPGIAIGGLSVGEKKEDMYRIIDVVTDTLGDIQKPVYLMGVGTPEDLIEGIARGIDMFDCVLPTRVGRHGLAFSSTGNIKVKNEQYKLSNEPLDKTCDCKVCTSYSLGYLRHLILENEILGMHLLSYHNLYFLINLTKKARIAIIEGKFEEFRKNFYGKYNKKIEKNEI